MEFGKQICSVFSSSTSFNGTEQREAWEFLVALPFSSVWTPVGFLGLQIPKSWGKGNSSPDSQSA